MIVRAGAPRPKTLDELLSPALLRTLDRLDLMSRRVFAGRMAGERRSKQRGRSAEFADYREYTPGDDIRFIDWNVYARLEKLFVKLHLEEQDLAVHIAVDASASMDAGGGARQPTKLVFAQRLAMALGYVGLVNHNRLSLSVWGRGPTRWMGECRGRRNVQRLAKFVLEEIGAEGEGPAQGFTDAMRGIAKMRRGAGVTIVISDFLIAGPEGYSEGLRFLPAGLGREAGGGRTHDVFCLQTLSSGELDPSAEGGEGERGMAGDVRLVDVESGAGVEVTVSAEVVKRYRARVDRYIADLASACFARGMTHVLCPSDTDIERVVTDLLRRRGLLK